jgi:hypothetical protein
VSFRIVSDLTAPLFCQPNLAPTQLSDRRDIFKKMHRTEYYQSMEAKFRREAETVSDPMMRERLLTCKRSPFKAHEFECRKLIL